MEISPKPAVSFYYKRAGNDTGTGGIQCDREVSRPPLGAGVEKTVWILGKERAMLYYLIICRSLTYAQRTAAVLERAGITARILRTPKTLVKEGCSHSVKIAQRKLPDALRVLHWAELTPKRIYMSAGEGGYQEVEL